MLENIIVAALVLSAAAFTVYRVFFAPSCGCGKEDGKSCASGASCCKQSASTPKAGSSPCGSDSAQCGCGKPLQTAPEQPRDVK